jgi:hypothetical protein
VRVSDSSSGTNPKNVSVFVWWQDSIGIHKSVITRDLGGNKL